MASSGMRYKPGHKEEARLKIVEGVGRGFRSLGFAGSGVDGLAKAAGVTSGAFYAHFASKSAAFEAVLTAGLDEVIVAIPEFQRKNGKAWTQAFVDYYVGKRHRNDLANGCTMASLTSDVIRSNTKTQAIYESKMAQIAELVGEGLMGGTHEERLARSWAMLSILIGGVNITRAMKSTKQASAVADSVGAAAVRAAGKTKR